MNPVIIAIEEGHIAHWTKDISITKPTEEAPTICKKDGEKWPCDVIEAARKTHRKDRGENPYVKGHVDV